MGSVSRKAGQPHLPTCLRTVVRGSFQWAAFRLHAVEITRSHRMSGVSTADPEPGQGGHERSSISFTEVSWDQLSFSRAVTHGPAPLPGDRFESPRAAASVDGSHERDWEQLPARTVLLRRGALPAAALPGEARGAARLPGLLVFSPAVGQFQLILIILAPNK